VSVSAHGRFVIAGVSGSKSRPLLIRSADGRPLNDNRWHDIAIVIDSASSTSGRTDLRHTVHVDNTTSTDWLPRPSTADLSASVGLVVELFIGGVTPGLYHSLPKQVSNDALVLVG